MKGAPFRHIGGALIADHGPLTLAQARGLAAFYREEAAQAAERGSPEGVRVCQRRAVALAESIRAAETWRRAAGWRDPDAADGRGR